MSALDVTPPVQAVWGLTMDLVNQLLAAMNAHDLEAAAALFHEDYRSEQPAHPGRDFVGRAQMHANWGAILAGFPDFHAELLRSVQGDDLVWAGRSSEICPTPLACHV